MSKHYRWQTTLDARRAADPGIDAPERIAAARETREKAVLGHLLGELRKERGLTQADVAAAMGVSQVRVSRMENGEIDRMQVDSIASYIAALGGHLRLVADFGPTSTTFADYTDRLSA
ncbi:helix-turn-helix domain-containing protein [Streptomyces sp. NPDC059506]|uniref:HTH cro/C1-type domain-containing protein n=1 Tax=Streptomyces thermolineatus TaxID=44033 RepID=A0ABP5ZJ68_9ACTN|nr:MULTISPECIES: helix-turn-helix domain-containing protein [unclassified Streptomyces]MCZ2523995.1 XRE family transcriptional regulator [Streptomyces sp. HB2AG]PLW72462.1 transcriptional regulator [Streptomyces sp. DJ]QMV22816.1 helix-turn-helix domain-containing protein [Streptomyces sp. SCUT-3]